MGLDPMTHRPRTDHLNLLSNLQQILAAAKIVSTFTSPNNCDIHNALRLQSDATQLAKLQLLQNIFQGMASPSSSISEPLNPLGSLNSLPDALLNDLLGLNHSTLQNLYDGSVDFSSQIQPNFQNFEATTQGGRSSSCRESQGLDEKFGSTNGYPLSSNNSLPNLVCASPERSTDKEEENMINSRECSNSNPACSTTFELTWGDFMDEEATDTYWKGFVE